MAEPRLEWGSDSWQAEVSSWVTDSLVSKGISTFGELTEHATQPWSTIWTIRGDGERFWLKATIAEHAREGELHATLARLAPGQVDPPVAVEPSRGWSLTRDGGATLLRSDPPTRGVELDTVMALLMDYASLQRATLPARVELLGAGLREFDVREAARTAELQAEQLNALPVDDLRRISDESAARVRAALPALEEAGEALASGPVPAAFDQGDLWPGNVFPPRAGGHYRVFDFADAAWAHPFTSLAMLAAECVFRWQLPQPDDEIDLRDERIRTAFDVYLAPWTDFATLDELRELLGQALRIAPVLRTAAWIRNLRSATGTALAVHAGMPWAWLEDVTKPVRL